MDECVCGCTLVPCTSCGDPTCPHCDGFDGCTDPEPIDRVRKAEAEGTRTYEWSIEAE